MTDRSDEIARRASDNRFRRGREALSGALERLLGLAQAAEPLRDADRAAGIAAEALAGHRAAEEHAWAIVRRTWSVDDRTAVVALVHAISTNVGDRSAWFIVPDREPQVVAISSEVVLDNPLGFAALADYELVLLDQEMQAGLWLGRLEYHYGRGVTRYGWEVEVWGSEPWLSAAARALRGEQDETDSGAG